MGLGDFGDDLEAHGTIFVRGIDQVEKVGSDGQGQFMVGQFRAGEFLGRKGGQEFLELFDGGDAVFELPAPIVPIGIGNVVSEAASGGFEFL